MDLSSWDIAQRYVLGCLLLWPEETSGEVFARAKPQHFGDAAMRHLFEAARGLWEQNRPIDAVTVLGAAGGKETEALIRRCITGTATPNNLSAWLDQMASCARTSAMQEDALRILNAKEESEALAAYEHIGETLRGVGSVRHVSLAGMISSYLDRMQDGTPPDYLKFGINKLDEEIAVSLGMFVVLGADSSTGKTALALQFAYSMAAAGKRVGFFSLETPQDSLEDRLMAERQVAGIRLPQSKKKALNQLDFEAAGQAGMRADNIPLHFFFDATTLQDLRAQILQWKLDVIFVDYVQLLDAPGEERWNIVSNISMGLHRMAQQLRVTVVGLSQITPPGKGARVQITKDDLRESRQLKHDADVILLLSRATEEDDPPEARVLEVAKNKDGRCPKMMLTFEPETMTFSYHKSVQAIISEGKAVKQKASIKKEKIDFEELPMSDLPDIPFSS